MDVRVLGPIEVVGLEGDIKVTRLTERALLARLALAGGTPVSDDRLTADLWGDEEVARPTQRLRVLASRMRSALGPGGVAVSRTPAGYRIAAQAVDLVEATAHADRLHAAARTGDHTGARAAAQAALGCWRGPALADLRTVPFARAEAERLDAWHRDLTVARIRADIELGGGPELVVELAALAGEHPLHEPIAALLATVLYRAGRQADALAALAALRARLADELGIDPAPDTAELELRMLRQDPALVATPKPVAAPVPVRAPTMTSPATSFVGRAGELAAVGQRVEEPGVLTLLGEPGSGKSRLAAEVARVVRATGRPVVALELAAIRREGPDAEDALLAELAQQTGAESGAGDLIATTGAALDGGLLVMDNAEHLVDHVAALVHRLRRVSPKLSVLVTSLRPLLVAGEVQHRVRPLEPAPAAALFHDRAAPHALDNALPTDVATICAAVDGLPLGIELAAGLTRTLTVGQLAERISDRMRLLVGGRRDGTGRHDSLRAALDWSHELLDEQQRAVLRRAAVFAGGFDLEAAEQVIPDGVVVDLGGVAPALNELVERCAVTVSFDSGGPRFGLLETVREYAATQLATAGEEAATRARHLGWCLAHVSALEARDGFGSAETVAAVFAEWANLAEALEQAVGTGSAPDGLRLANALHRPWLTRGAYREARRHLAALTAADAPPAERAHGLSNNAFHALMAGDLDDAAARLDQAAELAATVDDIDLAVSVHYHRGIVAIERGRLSEAVATLSEGERLARAGGARRASSFTDALGTAQLFAGDAEAALEGFRRGVAEDERTGDEHGLARGLSNQAKALFDSGRIEEALQAAEASDRYALQLDDRQILPLNDLVRAAVALKEGRLAEAESSCRAALAYTESGASMAHIDLADVLVARGELAEADGLLGVVYADATPRSAAWLAARAVSAGLALAGGDVSKAREIADSANVDYAAAGFGWRRYADRLAEVRAALGAAPV